MKQFEIVFLYSSGDRMTATFKADSMTVALEKAMAYKKATKQNVSQISIKEKL